MPEIKRLIQTKGGRAEAEKLFNVYKQFEKQAIEIKKEANGTDNKRGSLDLHIMSVEEAITALDDKIKESVSVLMFIVIVS